MGIPPAGNTINVSVCDYFRVDNGALTEHWGILDAAAMMQQLTAHGPSSGPGSESSLAVDGQAGSGLGLRTGHAAQAT